MVTRMRKLSSRVPSLFYVGAAVDLLFVPMTLRRTGGLADELPCVEHDLQAGQREWDFCLHLLSLDLCHPMSLLCPSPGVAAAPRRRCPSWSKFVCVSRITHDPLVHDGASTVADYAAFALQQGLFLHRWHFSENPRGTIASDASPFDEEREWQGPFLPPCLAVSFFRSVSCAALNCKDYS